MTAHETGKAGGLGDSSNPDSQLIADSAELELKALMALVPLTVRIVDRDGRIVRTNAAADREHMDLSLVTLRELWESERPHALSRDGEAGKEIPFSDVPGMRALAGEFVRSQLVECRQSGRLKVFEVSAAPLFDRTGRLHGAILVRHDVSDSFHGRSTEAEGPPMIIDAAQVDRLVEQRSRELLASQEEDVRRRRLAAIGQLAAGVMHDVNNALNPIMAAAYLLQYHAESPAAVREYAERIRTAAEMGAATASRVGRFIRQEPLHSANEEDVDLSVLIKEVLDVTEPMRLRRTVGSHEVRVETVLEDGVRCRGVAGEIREALLNLIQNAIDAMPQGGVLTVRCWRSGEASCVSVQDTGVGMSAEVRERAFEPFFTTKGSHGSGLGLAEVYGIARRHSGQVTIASTPEVGTTVNICFPRIDESMKRAEQQAPKPEQVKSKHILVVEDHDDGRILLRRILEREGHQVRAVASVAEARDALGSRMSLPFDLMLTDVGLPDGSGWELVREARELCPAMRIGVITGWEPSAESEETAGVEFVLRKPLRAQDLKAHIDGRKISAFSKG